MWRMAWCDGGRPVGRACSELCRTCLRPRVVVRVAFGLAPGGGSRRWQPRQAARLSRMEMRSAERM